MELCSILRGQARYGNIIDFVFYVRSPQLCPSFKWAKYMSNSAIFIMEPWIPRSSLCRYLKYNLRKGHLYAAHGVVHKLAPLTQQHPPPLSHSHPFIGRGRAIGWASNSCRLQTMRSTSSTLVTVRTEWRWSLISSYVVKYVPSFNMVLSRKKSHQTR